MERRGGSSTSGSHIRARPIDRHLALTARQGGGAQTSEVGVASDQHIWPLWHSRRRWCCSTWNTDRARRVFHVEQRFGHRTRLSSALGADEATRTPTPPDLRTSRSTCGVPPPVQFRPIAPMTSARRRGGTDRERGETEGCGLTPTRGRSPPRLQRPVVYPERSPPLRQRPLPSTRQDGRRTARRLPPRGHEPG